MKKLICIVFSMVLSFVLCGCDTSYFFEDFSAKEVFSQFLSPDKTVIEQEIIEEYYVYSPEFDSCYNSLNKEQKKIYKKIYSAAEIMPQGFVKLCEEYDGVVADVSIAYQAVLNDNAEIFWMPDTYLLGKKHDSDKVNICIAFSYSDEEQHVEYIVSAEERDSMREELKSKTAEIITASSIFNEDYEIEKFLNDYICTNTEYNKDAPFCDTAYGCLVLGQALCEGYSRGFKLLCNEARIECDLISGRAEDVAHMWNTVNINGIRSFVDVTWNDQNNKSYAYFNITKSQLEFDHTVAPLFTELNESKIINGKTFNFVERDCTSIENTYYKRMNCVFDDANKTFYNTFAAQKIEENVNKNVFDVTFLFDSQELLKSFNSDNELFITKIQKELKNVFISGYSFERDVLTLIYEVL